MEGAPLSAWQEDAWRYYEETEWWENDPAFVMAVLGLLFDEILRRRENGR